MNNKLTPQENTAADNKSTGDTRVQKEEDGSAPRLPHERDESADSQPDLAPADQERADKAHSDVERGVVDTDKGPVIDQVYDKVRRSSPEV